MTAASVTPAELTATQRALLRPEANALAALSPDGSAVAFVRLTPAGSALVVWRDGRESVVVRLDGTAVLDLGWAGAEVLVHLGRGPDGSRRLTRTWVREGRTRVVPSPGPVLRFWTSGDAADVVFAALEPGTVAQSLHRVADSGDVTLVAAAEPYREWLVDRRLRPRGGVRLTPDGGAEVWLAPVDGVPAPVHRVDLESLADLRPLGFSAAGDVLYCLSSAGLERRSLLALGPHGARLCRQHPELDLGGFPIGGDGAWLDPVTGEPMLCSVQGPRIAYLPMTDVVAGQLERLSRHVSGHPALLGWSRDRGRVLLADVGDDRPMRYAVWDAAADRLHPVVENRPDLAGASLRPLTDLVVPVEGGGTIEGYVVRPAGATGPTPGVLLVHGGPASRDIWRFDAEAQLLAAAGYTCLRVNYRGSAGSGKAFRAAGYGEWGGLMQDDLYATVSHAARLGLVDPARIAFYGLSFGGYASLLAATLRPDVVRCAVALSPLCDLVSFVVEPPPFWRALRSTLRRQVAMTADGRALGAGELAARSPLHLLSAETAPALVAWGERDPSVPVADIHRFVARAAEAGAPVVSLPFADEGHVITAVPTRERLYAEVLRFLAEHLE